MLNDTIKYIFINYYYYFTAYSTVDAGFSLRVLHDFDSSLKDISYIYSCKFMHSENSEEVELAFSGNGSDKTHIFDVTQCIQKPIKLDAFQKGNSYSIIILFI